MYYVLVTRPTKSTVQIFNYCSKECAAGVPGAVPCISPTKIKRCDKCGASIRP